MVWAMALTRLATSANAAAAALTSSMTRMSLSAVALALFLTKGYPFSSTTPIIQL
jgi:hypothetical protein